MHSQRPGSTYVVVGASSGLGRHLAQRFAAAGHALALVSSDLRDLSALASHLSLSHGVRTEAVAWDLAHARGLEAAIDEALSRLPPLAGVLLPAGMNDSRDVPGAGEGVLTAVTAANFVAPCNVIEHLLERLRLAPEGLVVGFGSIAAARGRTRNAAYGAAKRALQSYFESLRHALAGSHVVVQFYVLGYLDTNLAFGQETALPKASPRVLADVVYRKRGTDFGVAYFPRFWRPVCVALRALPWFIFRRLSF